MSVLLLPSPLLPVSAYAGLASALERAGTEVDIAPVDGGPGLDPHALVREWAGLVEPGTTLLAHSNAGYLAPATWAAAGSVGRDAGGVVFMDAALPPESGPAPLAPARFREHLAGLADDDGLLPPWTRWWPREAVTQVIPADRFPEIDRECPRLPLSYFDTEMTPPSGWTAWPQAYLAFGSTYADELTAARSRGWPHRTMPGGHLHFLVDPDEVARAVLGLRERLTGPAARRPPGP